MNWKLIALFGVLSAGPLAAQQPQRLRVTAPVLKNRAEIVAERQRIAHKLLQRGDSLTVMVYAYVDEKGATRNVEFKTSSGNAAADTAALALVKSMTWTPALNAARGVMISVPVKLVRK